MIAPSSSLGGLSNLGQTASRLQSVFKNYAPTSAPAATPGLSEYQLLQQSERRGVLDQYGGLRQELEKRLHRAGISRSGFAGEEMTKLGAQEQGALSDVESGVTKRLQDYKYQQEQLGLQRQQLALLASANRKSKKKKRRGILGSALGAIGTVGGALLGGPLGAMIGGNIGTAVGGAAS